MQKKLILIIQKKEIIQLKKLEIKKILYYLIIWKIKNLINKNSF